MPRNLFIVCTSLVALGAPGVVSLAAEQVFATLADGRQIQGFVDSRTDDHYLWLRRAEAEFDVTSGFPWSAVTIVELDKKPLEPGEMRTRLKQEARPGRAILDLPVAKRDEGRVEQGTAVVEHGIIRGITIDARLAQWDGDAAWDGLLIQMSPFDGLGRLVPVQGHVEFTLVFETRSRSPGPPPRFEAYEHSSSQLQLSHFANGPAIYRLPFRSWHPDFDLMLSDTALVHARLSVPSVGVFEASDACVLLREISHFRDNLELHRGHRYLPRENAGHMNR